MMKKILLISFLSLYCSLFSQSYYVCLGPYAEAMHKSYNCASANCSKETVTMNCYEAIDKGYDYCEKCTDRFAGMSLQEKFKAHEAELNMMFPKISDTFDVKVFISGCDAFQNNPYKGSINVVGGDVKTLKLNPTMDKRVEFLFPPNYYTFDLKMMDDKFVVGYGYPSIMFKMDQCGNINYSNPIYVSSNPGHKYSEKKDLCGGDYRIEIYIENY